MTLSELIDRTGKPRNQIAVDLGVSPSNVTRWCSGEYRIPIEMLRPVAKCLGVTLDDVVSATERTLKARRA